MSRNIEHPLIAVLLLSVFLAGCDSPRDANDLFVDYQQRVGNVLDIEPPTPVSPRNIGIFPSRDERLFALPDMRMGMLDVYALRTCRILPLIAERNSQLGKLAAASQHWLYELELWRRLRQCWTTATPDRLEADDRQRLLALTLAKTQQLPKASWNAIFDSDEWVGGFSRASHAPSPESAWSLGDDLAALAYLRHAILHQFDPAWSPESATLEGHLKILRQRPLSAQLLRGLLLATQRLEELSDTLETHLAERPICYKGHSNPRADYLYNVFVNTFIGEVQPYLADLTRASRDWLSAVNHLLSAFSVSRPAIDHYQDTWLSLSAPDAPWQQFLAATQRHVRIWQAIWRSCGMLPGEKGGSRT
ncbi:MAG: DUF3080 domain-containing protein [Halomonas sp.]|nr:DUF3080 domain-containing protein [Halomonas sp.]